MDKENKTQTAIMNLLLDSENPQLIRIAQELPNSTFFTAHCHTHHRYRGGLADHSLGVAQSLLANDALVQRYGRDNLIFAGMFHDLCTAKHPAWVNIGLSSSGRRRHGARSVHILGDYFHIHLHDDVYDAIKNHMHRTNPRYNPLWVALRHADGASAATKP